jgi:Xaa-Pro dipeptidase
MERHSMDALVAWGGTNFHYLSGFQNYFDNPGASVAVLPREEAQPPFLLVAEWVEEAARSASWIDEVRGFPVWLEIFDRRRQAGH